MTYDELRQSVFDAKYGDKDLGAFCCFSEEPDPLKADALLAAPLGGMPVGIKDLIDTANLPTEYGSKVYSGNRPKFDAAIVTALRRAGAFIVGKTTTTEFATSPPTKTLNPRDRSRTPGGSSAGSAAAVAAGLVPLAVGTQTLGSVIRPASFCGVIGFKPTYGWFPTAGVKSLAPSLDTIGFFANNTRDLIRVLEALAPTVLRIRGKVPRLAFTTRPNWSIATPDAQNSFQNSIAIIRSSELEVEDLALPEEFECLTEAAIVIHDYEMYRTLASEFDNSPSNLDPALYERIARAGAVPADRYYEALALARAWRARFSTLTQDFDATLCLAASSEAPLGLTSTGTPAMNSAWTALHLPLISLPVMKGGSGAPIGLQLVGQAREDRGLLAIAEAVLAAFQRI